MARSRPAAGATEKESPAPETPTPAAPAKAARRVNAPATVDAARPGAALRLADALLVGAFLGLAFLLGCFPLKDTDFWWHLKTGDIIRQTWRLPVEDWYTFGAEGHGWVDLHWLFEVLLSWGYAHGGVVTLNLAKCVITCTALYILFSSRRREWPAWAMVLAWLPALLLLSGRMYVRPETLTLLYLSIYLAVLSRWDEYPRLGFLLPVVQVLWVNTQGLFVLGPIVLTFGLIDAALRRGAFGKARRPWWRSAGIATAGVGLACVLNPYGLLGAVFPIELARTMNARIFSDTIAELLPVTTYIEQMGIRSLPIQLHVATLMLGALSFLLPIAWLVADRANVATGAVSPPPPAKKGKGRKGQKRGGAEAPREELWRLSAFRVLLFAAFSILGLKATRNSHQFAAVVGAVTAWNFAEWAAAIRRRRLERGAGDGPARGWIPRLVAASAVLLVATGVASGTVYALAGEGRTIGLGEEPLWFPHEAAKFAGREDMPRRFVCFHNGHAALYEYYNGPERKVFADARLEVMGPEVYGEYVDLNSRIRTNSGGWEQTLAAMGNPGILVDNVHAKSGLADMTATLMADGRFRCAWFDPIATVFVPENAPASIEAVDFAGRHFRPDPSTDPRGPAALQASARAIYEIASRLKGRGYADDAGPLILLGLGHARRRRDAIPADADGWKVLGLLESIRDPLGSPDSPVARPTMAFDPVFDLSPMRATYDLREALRRTPDDTLVMLWLALQYQARGMNAEAFALYERLATIAPRSQYLDVTRQLHEMAITSAARLKAELGAEPSSKWQNLDELDRAVAALLGTGRIEAAAELLASAYPVASRPWSVTDRLATLLLHLGRPAEARAAWQSAVAPPRPALVRSRVAATYLVEDDMMEARRSAREALALEPDLFEAAYLLALIERDAADADATLAAARKAESLAPTDEARRASRRLADLAAAYAAPPDAPTQLPRP